MTRELNQLTKKLTKKKRNFYERKLNFPFDLSKLHHHRKSAQMTVNSSRGGNELRTSEANEVETERKRKIVVDNLFSLIFHFPYNPHFSCRHTFPFFSLFSLFSRMKIEAYSIKKREIYSVSQRRTRPLSYLHRCAFNFPIY